jgi:uncharacterized protein YprB with RNaseH-like and TPR domain
MDQARDALSPPKRDEYGRFISKPPVFYDSVADLRAFGKMTMDGRKNVLLGGSDGFNIVGFDIEATHLKPNVGRILCCSFKPLGGEVYTLHGHDKRYMKKDVYDDSALAIAIRDELEKYDILIGWNSRMFDVKFINARLMRVGARTKDNQWHVDGMWQVRTKSAAWSGLDSVQKFILPDASEENTKTSVEWQKWMQALGWDKQLRGAAMAEIVDHCERDVRVLEDVYRQLVNTNSIRALRRDGGII